jgi:hypothetical protein
MMYHTELISMRLPTTLLQRLDQRRGPSSRAAYIRSLIEKDTRAAQPHPPTIEPDKETRLVTKRAETPPAADTTKKHLHRYVKKSVDHHDRGQPVYLRECACGDQKIE